MKKSFLIASLLLLWAAAAGAQDIRVDIEGVRTCNVPGPFAKYARQYLGINVFEEALETFEIKSAQLFLVSQGKESDDKVYWSECIPAEPSFDDVPYTKEMLAAASIDDKARLAAEIILKLRDTRMDILGGNTDASYTGEALGDAMQEISRLENLYLKLFSGYVTREVIKRSFTLDINKGNTSYVAFRVNDDAMPVDGKFPAGKPYILSVYPEKQNVSGATEEALRSVNPRKQRVEQTLVPCNCTVTLSDGMDVLIRTKLQLVQFGSTIYKIVNNN